MTWASEHTRKQFGSEWNEMIFTLYKLMKVAKANGCDVINIRHLHLIFIHGSVPVSDLDLSGLLTPTMHFHDALHLILQRDPEAPHHLRIVSETAEEIVVALL